MANTYYIKDTFSLFAKRDFEDGFLWGLSDITIQNNAFSKSSSDSIVKELDFQNENDCSSYSSEGYYFNYIEEIKNVKKLGISNFRFSLSWNHIITKENGTINIDAISFYNEVLDACLINGIEPFVTLCDWCLPEELEKNGGWSNREIIHWFEQYVTICVAEFKTKVKYWIVLTEPSVFTGANYYLTVNKFKKRNDNNFLPTLHHALLCQAIGFNIIKRSAPNSQVGTTFSTTHIISKTTSFKDATAASRVDALLNRTFIEPSLGLGYPIDTLPFLKNIKKYIAQGDNELIIAQFDFIGIQNYNRQIVAHNMYVPFINAEIISPQKINPKNSNFDFEDYSKTIYIMIKKYSSYEGVKKIIVIENEGILKNVNQHNDSNSSSTNFYKSNLEQLLLAKKIGGKIAGYFIQSSSINSEFAEFYENALI